MAKELLECLQEFVGRRAVLGKFAAGAGALFGILLGLPKEAFACHCCALCVDPSTCTYSCTNGYQWNWVCCQTLDGTRWKCWECYPAGRPPEPVCCNCPLVSCSKAVYMAGSCSP